MRASEQSLLCKLKSLTHPSIHAVGIFGSVARSLLAGRSTRGCGDLDLLIVCSNVAQSLPLLEHLPQQVRMPVEVMAIEEEDLAQGIEIGEVQILSLLSETVWVHAPARIRAYQDRVLRSQVRSGDRELQRLLDFALMTCSGPASPRTAKAALIAAVQALTLSAGIQPRGTLPLFGDVLPKLLNEGLAPPGAAQALACLNRWEPDKPRTPPVEVRSWVNEATLFTLRNASRWWFRSGAAMPEVEAILLDLGGTLLREEKNGKTAPVAGAFEILEDWSGEYCLAAVSNAPCSLQAQLDELNLSRFFDIVLLSQDLGAFKPERAVYSAAITRLGVPEATSVMIGDTLETDVFGPWRCGIRAIWIHPAFKGRQTMEDWGAIVPTLADAAQLLAAS
jgi:predicted HAD superfamily phosphohydrolase YqeG